MTNGIQKSLLYYSIGLGLAGLSYVTLGHQYVHGPGLHHIITFLTFLGGFLWMAGATYNYFAEERTETLKGIILTNLIMSAGFTIFLIYILRDPDATSSVNKNADTLTIENSGDTTTMYHNGSPVYLRVKDSVLLDYIDGGKN